ncbi:MAG TPA: hypothetical protein PLN53_07135 [Terricaulis sp.]|nr:hypothetical protein [Terricaulis sp.]
MKFVLAAIVALVTATPAFGQHSPEQLVRGAFFSCWQAEEGANFQHLVFANGFARVPQAQGDLYFRDARGVVIFLSASFSPGADGQPEPACRVTAMQPQLDTPWTPGGAPLPGSFVEVIARETQAMGYSLRALRQPHPRRAGRLRTILVFDGGARGRMIYIEEGPQDVEFLYFHASRAVFNDPATPDIGTSPAVRTPLQAFVNDRWTIAFCDLNPHACITREEQARIDARAAEARRQEAWTLPFSGIGASSGDNRSGEQRSRDSAWWDNYHRCGSGRC